MLFTKTKMFKKQNNQIGMLNDLPDCVLTDIFARLPVKSLLQFKCVCKDYGVILSKIPSSSQCMLTDLL